MSELVLYLIKSGVLLGILWLIYRLLLSELKLLRINRILLISGMVFSMLLPLIPTTTWFSTQQVFTGVTLPVIESGKSNMVNNPGIGILNYLLLLYGFGIALYLILFFLRISSLVKLLRQGRASDNPHPALVQHDGIQGAFTFFHRIIWNENSIRPEDRPVILRHELVHLEQKHSIDLLLIELITAIQWFNPFAYLLKKELKAVHEFLADEDSVSQESRPGQYLEAIYHFALRGAKPIYIFNSFGNVSLKRRLIMMNQRNQKSLWTRYILAFSLLAIFSLATTAFSSGSIEEPVKSGFTILDPYSAFEPQEKVFAVVKEMPEYPGGQEALMTFVGSNLNYPEKARKSGIEGTVYVSFTIKKNGEVSDVQVLRGIGGGCDEEAMRVVKMMPNWKPGKTKEGKIVATQMNLPLKFVLDGKEDKKEKK